MRNVATSKAKYFATISSRKQLKHLLNTPGIAELLKYRDNRHKHSTIGIEDVYDAECYKKMQEEGVLGPYDLTATINTDGCRSTKGATKETFPVFLRINEFPPHLRQRFMMLAAVYIDKEQPVMNTLLLPVVEELNKLSSRGVPRPAEGQQVESKLIVKCFCVDGKARGQVLNMDTHQSYNGCTYCDIRGVLVEDGESKKRTMRWPAYSDDPIPLFTDRNDRGMKDSMLLATQTRQVVQGHKGTSALMLLDHMDLRSGNCVDDLHVIYECAAPHITELILTVAPRQDKRMSDERLLSTIDERMKLIKSPSSISRKPGSCSIKNRKKFKGTQWRDWLIHYSLPCLEGLIENEHLQLLELLSRGAFLLSQDIILPEHIMEAETCFSEFLVLNQQIYGLSKTKLNLHTLVHAGRCVRENGGLWCYSTVNFESWNNKVIKCVMSPAGALLQIVVRHLVHMALSSAVSSHELFSPNVRAQLMKTLQKRRLVHVIKMSDDVYLAGRPKRRKVTNAENQVLSDQGFDNIEEVEEFDKILIRSTPFGIGNRRSLSDNSMIYTYSDIFCSIQSILKFQLQDGSEKCGLYVVHHQVGRLPFRYAKHIAVLSEDQDKFYFVSPEDVRMPCVKSKILGRTYVSPLPNSFEID